MIVYLDKHISEGWRVGDFVQEIEPLFHMIQSGRAMRKPFKKGQEEELKKWIMQEQPYYKQHIPEVFEYFKNQILE